MQVAAGSTHTIDFGLQDSDGKFLDLTGYTSRMQMRRDVAQPTPDFGFTNDRLSFIPASQQCRFVAATSSPLTVHADNHEFSPGERIQFATTGTLPGLTPGTTYYVISQGLTPYACQISETEGGAPIYSGVAMSGIHTVSTVNSGVVRLTIPASVTATMSGEYLYDLEIESAGGEVTRVLEGLCSISAEITR